MTMYKLTGRDTFLRLVDGAEFMLAEGNEEYQRYIAWLAEGNTPLPADQPNPADIIKQQLAALDAANPVTQRNLRELTLALAQVIATVTGLPAAANRGVQIVTAVEAEAQPLRDQLKAIERGMV